MNLKTFQDVGLTPPSEMTEGTLKQMIINELTDENNLLCMSFALQFQYVTNQKNKLNETMDWLRIQSRTQSDAKIESEQRNPCTHIGQILAEDMRGFTTKCLTPINFSDFPLLYAYPQIFQTDVEEMCANEKICK